MLSLKADEKSLFCESIHWLQLKMETKENGDPRLCADPKDLHELEKSTHRHLGGRRDETELGQNRHTQMETSPRIFFLINEDGRAGSLLGLPPTAEALESDRL